MANKVTVEVYVHQRVAGILKGEIFVSGCDLTKSEYMRGNDATVLLGTHSFEFEFPDYDMNVAAIAGFEEAIEAEILKTKVVINRYRDEIAKLQSIGHE